MKVMTRRHLPIIICTHKHTIQTSSMIQVNNGKEKNVIQCDTDRGLQIH